MRNGIYCVAALWSGDEIGRMFSFYFLLHNKKKVLVFVKNFDFRFLMNLHVLGCLEHDLTISRKYLSVCDKNFVKSVTRELMRRIS